MEAENTLDSTESSKSGATLLEETSVKPSDNNREEEPAAEGPNCNEKENVAESPDENSSREGLERKEMDKEKTVVIPDENVNIVENTTPTVAPDKEHRENVECMETEDTMPSNKKCNNSEELKGPSETCVLSNSNSESLDSDPSKNHLSDKPSQTSDAAEVTRDPNAEEYKDKDKDKGEDSTEKDDEKSEDSDNNDKDVASSSSKDTNNVEKATDATDLNKESNEKTQELENTEFVQISQDKGDDSQMEAPLIDAEDPFGGDTVPLENVEQMETDNLAGTTGTFHKLGDQADNLQDVVKAKETGLTFTHTEEDSVDSSRENENKEPSETTSLASTSETNQEVETVTVPKSGKTVEGEEAGESSKDKTVDKVNPIETSEQEQSSVLPGQDDELCIIPDSMKEIVPAAKSNETGGVSLEAKSKADNVDKSVKDKDVPVTDEESPDANKSQDKEKKADEKDQEKSSSKDSSPVVEVADVINIEDESKSEVEEIVTKEICKQCSEFKSCKIKVKVGQETYNVCSKACKKAFISSNSKATDIPSDGVNSKREKRCANCLLIVETIDERNLSWETMEFCNEECLGKFQTKYGSYCRNCNGSVQAVSLGKYCVRFGYDVRQFCCSICLEEFKKGLKVCSYCQKDISSGTEGFLAPVGDKGQFKDFCTQDCMEKYSKMSSSEPAIPEKKVCSVCQEEKIVHCEVIVDRSNPVAICSDPCFAAFKFVNKVDPEQCSTCKKFFECPAKKGYVVFYENEAHTFCTKTCLNVFIITNRKIVPCNWCKVKKYNFDMIKKELKTGQVMMMCSLNCLTLYQVSINAVSARRINCDFCKEFSQAQYHLTMSDATIRNFCSYNCVMNFQGQYTKSPITIPASDDPVPTGMPKRTVLPQRVIAGQVLQKPGDKPLEFAKKHMPVISSVTSLATIGNGQVAAAQTTSAVATTVPIQNHQNTQIIYKQQVITRPTSPVKILNRMTQCKPLVHTKGVSVRPHPCTKSTQTDEVKKILIPVPVPIYVPVPMHMYSMPFPVPLPFPLPIPVPIFIPTTRNSAKGIFKEIKRIQEKIPADPFEAELLMMAEMVATEKKANESDSDSADENRDEDSADPGNTHTDGFSEEGVDASNTFGDDMLQMALKMAGELDEQAVDLEAALTPNTITATQPQNQQDSNIENEVQPERLIASRGRKRMAPYKPRSTPSKRGRRVSAANDIPLMPPPEPQPPPQPRILEPMEKPDANMALKYTFGVNAWRQWVIAKNAELEKQITPTRKVKLFKTDLLQLTADELNYSLCLFVKEVRKPNGAEYAPDTIYYLCLGIQQYLFENNRIDNIFTDSYYEKFTECLNEVAKKFSVLYNDAQYIVTRVEEEHLWECKQLGAHSPHVLLSTLMFFNTKHFNLVTVEEHMQLSFSHIMKHWKRNPAAQPAAVAGKAPGSRNVLLRFYPPQSALEGNSRKKKVYEQQENEDNPLRCPVKLYEFYLSKCPESVKTRNDVFYLLPERSCVPDSPVWYSTSPLAKEHLMKMLYRTKMVKEINVSLLTS